MSRAIVLMGALALLSTASCVLRAPDLSYENLLCGSNGACPTGMVCGASGRCSFVEETVDGGAEACTHPDNARFFGGGRPDRPVWSTERLYTAASMIQVSGTTSPGARVSLTRWHTCGQRWACTYADESGRYSLLIPTEGSHQLTAVADSPRDEALRSECSERMVVVADFTGPTIPGTMVATPRSRGALVEWAQAHDEAGIKRYDVAFCAECTTFRPDAFIDVGTRNAATIALLPRTLYLFAVRAVDGAGNAGPFTEVVSARTLD